VRPNENQKERKPFCRRVVAWHKFRRMAAIGTQQHCFKYTKSFCIGSTKDYFPVRSISIFFNPAL